MPHMRPTVARSGPRPAPWRPLPHPTPPHPTPPHPTSPHNTRARLQGGEVEDGGADLRLRAERLPLVGRHLRPRRADIRNSAVKICLVIWRRLPGVTGSGVKRFT